MRTLDAFLPEYEFSERHRIRIDAPAGRVDAVVREIVADDLPLVRLLSRLRALGRSRASRRPFVDLGVRLDDVPGEGLVVGLTGQFWRLRAAPLARPRSAEEFLAYDRKDVCKAVVDFRIAGGELATETRVHVGDPAARRSFRRYWRVIRPFSGVTRVVFLREAKRRAEAAR